MINVTLLGTAALFPTPERALTAVSLINDGVSILFDCGEGTQTAARKAGVSLMKINLLAFTHYHGDHIFGLPGLLQTIARLGRTEPFYITGPETFGESLEPFLKWLDWLPYEVKFIKIPNDGLKLSEIANHQATAARLSCFKTVHRVPSQGYCFTLERAGKFLPQKAKELGVPINQWKFLQQGKSLQVGDKIILPEQVLGEPRKGLKFVFTGDTSPCNSLTAAAENADLMISEATFGENEQSPVALKHGHMTFAQAAETAKNANVKQLWLAHFSHRIENPQEYLPNATAIFENTICGNDGMSINLKFQD